MVQKKTKKPVKAKNSSTKKSNKATTKRIKKENTKTSQNKSNKKNDLKNKNILYSIISGIILLLIILTFTNIYSNNADDTIVAKVGNIYITSEELNSEYKNLPEQYKEIISKEQYLEDLYIPQRIISEQAKVISDERLEEEYNNFLIMTGYTDSEIKQSLAQNDVSFEKFLDSLRIQVFLNDTLYDQIILSEDELFYFYDTNKEGLLNEFGDIISFEEIKEDIKDFLFSQKLQEKSEIYIAGLKSEMEIKIFYENINSVTNKETATKEETTIQTSGTEQKTDSTNLNLKEFNDCMAENGVVIYGSRTCPFCTQLVNLLGGKDATSSVYVECSEFPERCRNEMIGSGVPEIQINGKMYQGARTIESLAAATGC